MGRREARYCLFCCQPSSALWAESRLTFASRLRPHQLLKVWSLNPQISPSKCIDPTSLHLTIVLRCCSIRGAWIIWVGRIHLLFQQRLRACGDRGWVVIHCRALSNPVDHRLYVYRCHGQWKSRGPLLDPWQSRHCNCLSRDLGSASKRLRIVALPQNQRHNGA